MCLFPKRFVGFPLASMEVRKIPTASWCHIFSNAFVLTNFLNMFPLCRILSILFRNPFLDFGINFGILLSIVSTFHFGLGNPWISIAPIFLEGIWWMPSSV